MKNVLNRLGWVCLFLFFCTQSKLFADCTVAGNVNISSNPFSGAGCSSGVVVFTGTLTVNTDFTVPSGITRLEIAGALVIGNFTLSLSSGTALIIRSGATLSSSGSCNSNPQITVGTAPTVQIATCNGGGGATFTFLQVQSGGGLTSTGLPITISTFQARSEEGGALITWKVSTEINNDKMLVERSKDGQRFREIGQVKGRGTSTIPFEYQYFDNNPGVGDTYYRLKQVDFDGTFEYSKVIALNTEGFIQLYTYPNPTRERIFVRSTEEVVLAGLHLFDGLGRKFLLQWSGGNGLYEAALPKGLPTGLYVLSDASGAHQGKISIQQ
jgi:hypothetical protein